MTFNLFTFNFNYKRVLLNDFLNEITLKILYPGI
jgi:hypothetical protein